MQSLQNDGKFSQPIKVNPECIYNKKYLNSLFEKEQAEGDTK